MLTNKTGSVQYLRSDKVNWIPLAPDTGGLPLYARDWIRTLENSTAIVWMRNNNSSVRLRELSTLQILPREKSAPLVSLLRGALYFFSRESSQELEINTPYGTGAPRGTEFVMLVETNQTIMVMFDGVATLTNDAGGINLHSGEAAVARDGQPPVKIRLELLNLVQWWLYYPGVVDVDELELTSSEKLLYGDSVTIYKKGDLAGALRTLPGYPSPVEPGTDGGRVYLAALYLAAGEVGKAETLLNKVLVDSSVAMSLRWVIAAAQMKVDKPPQIRTSASEWLGLSYYFQARHELKEALNAAKRSTAAAPDFSFAWERVAELEFSFGRIADAKRALATSLRLAPLNPEAHALQGFLFSAENKLHAARREFEEAIHLDPKLGNAWLGRGLVRIKIGESVGGKADLQMAAVLEPNRSLYHSYQGKAFQDAGDDRNATLELARAKALDANDPTPSLYSALLNQQQNRINEAISDLEESQKLNTNRSVYRSRLLLDQDAAVSSANLASIYRDAGMTDVSVREAARAVNEDEANSSAHLFLSDSYNQLRDPTEFNLRYETVWFNELLLANLLAPVGGGRLAQNVSQQEYSKLFQADGLGFANTTVARSDKSLTQRASQYGTFGNTSYALDLTYQHNDGVRPNNDLDSIQWDTTIKQQITSRDTALALVQYRDYHSGDNFQYYDQNSARKYFRFDENQQPTLLGGWHHEWAPGVHTLLLGGRLENEQHFSDKAAPQLAVLQDTSGRINGVAHPTLNVEYHNKLEVFTAELRQIVQWDRVTLSAGGRYQSGDFATSSLLNAPPHGLAFLFTSPPSDVSATEGFERLTGYGYLTVEPVRRLWLTGGLAYEDMTYPRNFRSPPISSGTDHVSQIGPKAAVVWNPFSPVTLRGVYTKSLGGVSLDESYRLEPTQFAGFPQAFRSLIPESVVGSVAAPKYQTFGLAMDLKFPTGTYAGIQVQRLEASLNREDGIFSLFHGRPPMHAATTPESLNYRENAFSASINQLLGKHFVVGADYSFAQVRLDDSFPGIPTSVSASAQREMHSELHQVGGHVVFNHPSGFFARAETHWYAQSNSGYGGAMPGDSFFLENLFAGWRFAHRHAQITAGILNLFDSEYHLNPLTIHEEWPHQRTFTLQLDFIY